MVYQVDDNYSPLKKQTTSVNPFFDLAKLIFEEKFLVDLAIK
jgi:hypothetical protein